MRKRASLPLPFSLAFLPVPVRLDPLGHVIPGSGRRCFSRPRRRPVLGFPARVGVMCFPKTSGRAFCNNTSVFNLYCINICGGSRPGLRSGLFLVYPGGVLCLASAAASSARPAAVPGFSTIRDAGSRPKLEK